MGRLNGKIAIITGGASGVGEAAAKIFTAEGAHVVIADVDDANGARVVKEVGGKTLYVRTDVSRSADVEALVKKTVDTFGRLDILFNNAGICISGRSILELKEEDFDRQIAINLKGVWLGMKHGIAAMLKTGGGAIVNTASTAGLLGYSGLSGYGASKTGVVGLTRHIAVEFAHQGVRVNAICPGAIFTPMSKYLWPGKSDAEHLERNALSSPMKRVGMPEDMARAALLLLSDDAGHITGHIMPVDAGVTASVYRGPAPDAHG